MALESPESLDLSLQTPKFSPTHDSSVDSWILGSIDDSESSRSDQIWIKIGAGDGDGDGTTPNSTLNESQPPHNPSPAVSSPVAMIEMGVDLVMERHLPSSELDARHIVINVNNHNGAAATDAESEGKSLLERFFMEMGMAKDMALVFVALISLNIINKTISPEDCMIAFFGFCLMCASLALHHPHPKHAYAMQVSGFLIFMYIICAMLDSYISGVNSPLSRWSHYFGFCLCLVDIATMGWIYCKS